MISSAIFALPFPGQESLFKKTLMKWIQFQNVGDEANRWQAALKEITQIPGYILTDKSESEFIDEIVRDALEVLRSNDKKNMIGMDMHIKEILSLLCIESPDVCSIGLWGTDIHKEVELKGHNAVREELFSKLFEVEPDVVQTSNIKTSFLRSRLQRKSALLVLDNVNDFRDVETFVRMLSYFGPRSRIIITSRNRHVFVQSKIDHVYKAYKILSLELVKFSNGNPQVLQFCSKSDLAWDQLSQQVQKSSALYIPVIENHGVYLPQGLEYLPSKLRLLHWEHYPISTLPQCFDPKNLVELNLPNSCVKKLWKGKKSLENLKKMRLSYSYQLTKIPRLSSAPNLELLDLEGCKSLVSISQSICYLRKLVSLNLKDCSNLESVPSTVELESLEVLNLSGCSKLENFPEISPNVKELYLG
ncbi:hypothetical protein Bca4012_019891 [Brassica carinata]